MNTNGIDVPILKASPSRLFELLLCAYNHPFDRDGFRDSILGLYPGKTEKSVFRGMVIPTLRRLGLIMGYDYEIRPSANGVILVLAHKGSLDEGLRALRVVLLELDKTGPHFVEFLKGNQSLTKEGFEYSIRRHMTISNIRQASERIRDWVQYLTFSQLTNESRQSISINCEMLRCALQDKDVEKKIKRESFPNLLFEGYRVLVGRQKGLSSVDISDLRTKVASDFYERHNEILTEAQFDTLLGNMPRSTNNHTISFGRSMGSEEKLFVANGHYYQTISVRFERDAKDD